MLSRDMKALHSRETSSIFITITILNKNVPQENDGYTVIIITVMLPTNWRKEWQSTPVLLPEKPNRLSQKPLHLPINLQTVQLKKKNKQGNINNCTIPMKSSVISKVDTMLW